MPLLQQRAGQNVHPGIADYPHAGEFPPTLHPPKEIRYLVLKLWLLRGEKIHR